MTFDEAIAFALTLPDTVAATHYGGPAVKVASNGRAFLSAGHEKEEAFCLAVDLDTIEMLKATAPETFYQTPHYVGWPAVLVRYESPDPERVKEMIALARDEAARRQKARPRRRADSSRQKGPSGRRQR